MTLIRITTSSTEPIWRQIQQEIRRLIAAGHLSVGDSVPSVRDLGREILVNPATIAKAYRGLVDEGLLETRRGEGTFVAAETRTLSPRQKKQTLETEASRFASVSVTVGADHEEALEHVTRALEQTYAKEEVDD